jgi:iron complex transport system substrate-binding protein
MHCNRFCWSLTLTLISALIFPTCSSAPEIAAQAEPGRIVSLNGAITETVVALGQGRQLVGIDVTSTYPEDSLGHLPSLGHVRQLGIEGVLSLHPTLVLVDDREAKLPAVQALRDAGITVASLPVAYTLEGPAILADTLARLLGVPDQGEQLANRIRMETAALPATSAGHAKLRVLFIYARGAGNLQVAGIDTPADAVIRLAGGQNAGDAFSGFRPLSAEGLLAARPDVLLFFTSGLASLGGPDGVLQLPGIAQTPAGQNKAIIGMDGLYLLGFTPRAPQAIAELARRLEQLSSSDNSNL